MLSTHHAGEYFDYRGDILSNQLHKNKFAGGSRVLPSGKIPPAIALWTSVITFVVAAAIGIILQFVFKTGPYTLILGALGAFSGFFTLPHRSDLCREVSVKYLSAFAMAGCRSLRLTISRQEQLPRSSTYWGFPLVFRSLM